MAGAFGLSDRARAAIEQLLPKNQPGEQPLDLSTDALRSR